MPIENLMVVRGKRVTLHEIYEFFKENLNEVSGKFVEAVEEAISFEEDDLIDWIGQWFGNHFGKTSFKFKGVKYHVFHLTHDVVDEEYDFVVGNNPVLIYGINPEFTFELSKDNVSFLPGEIKNFIVQDDCACCT